MPRNNEEIQDYLEKGTDIVAGAAGAALGSYKGVSGAIFGSAIGSVLAFTLKDIIHRKFSNREEKRVAASCIYMITGIEKNLDEGWEIRKDFFDDYSKGRNSSVELFEGILLKCKGQYQEKKIKYISSIFDEVLFDPSLSFELSNQILSIAENCTYQELCIISFFGQLNTSYDRNELAQFDFDKLIANFKHDYNLILQNIVDLGYLGVLDNKGSFNNYDVMHFYEAKLTELGGLLFALMNLFEIDKKDTDRIFNFLKYNNNR